MIYTFWDATVLRATKNRLAVASSYSLLTSKLSEQISCLNGIFSQPHFLLLSNTIKLSFYKNKLINLSRQRPDYIA